MFRPEYTMYNFTVHDDAKANGSVHSRVLRTLLTSNLIHIIPALQDIIASTLHNEVEGGLQRPDGIATSRSKRQTDQLITWF